MKKKLSRVMAFVLASALLTANSITHIFPVFADETVIETEEEQIQDIPENVEGDEVEEVVEEVVTEEGTPLVLEEPEFSKEVSGSYGKNEGVLYIGVDFALEIKVNSADVIVKELDLGDGTLINLTSDAIEPSVLESIVSISDAKYICTMSDGTTEETMLTEIIPELLNGVNEIKEDLVSPTQNSFTFTGITDHDGISAYYVTNGNINIGVSDNNGIDLEEVRVLVDGVDITSTVNKTAVGATATYSIPVNSLEDGTRALTVITKDYAGNTIQEDNNFNLLREVPKISGVTHSEVNQIGDTSYTNKNTFIELGGTIQDFIKGVTIKKDGSPILILGTNTVFTISYSGEYTIEVEDVLGEIEEYRLEDLFTDITSKIIKDTTNPTISSPLVNGSALSNSWYSTTAIISVDVADESLLSDVVLDINNGAYTKTTTINDLSNTMTFALGDGLYVSDNGIYNIKITATDAANNKVVKSFTVKYDFQKPEKGTIKGTGSVVESDNKLFTSSNVVISGNAIDNQSGIDKIELGKDGIYTKKTLPITLSESGTYDINIYDKVGNVTNITLGELLNKSSSTLVIDKFAPIITKIDGFTPDIIRDSEEWYNHSPAYKINVADDNIKDIKTYFNDSEVENHSTTGDYTVQTPNDLEGKITLKVVAKDKTGSVSEMSYVFNIDKTAPDNINVSINKSYYEKGGELFFSEIPTLNISAEDTGFGEISYYIERDGEILSSSTGTFVLTNGTYSVYTKDGLGNTSDKKDLSDVLGTSSSKIEIDENAPIIEVSKDSANYNDVWYKNDVHYAVTLKDDVGINHYELSINGEVLAQKDIEEVGQKEYKEIINTNSANQNSDGSYKVKISVEDNAGNTKEYSDIVYVDRESPVIENFTFTGNGNVEGLTINGQDRYGIFFDGEATCDIHVSDGNISSGIAEVNVELVTENGEKTSRSLEIQGTTATLKIPNNFKGFISAYAVDNVTNVGTSNYPDGIVTEDSNWHINNVSVDINLPETSYTDINGLPLYNQDMSANAVLGCKISGIKEISWGIDDSTFGTVSVDLDGNISGDIDSIKAKTKNLVLDLNKSLAIQGNSNGLTVWVSLVDRTGHTSQNSRTFSIDKDAPIITVSYDVNETSGFYNQNRVASISVEERNFDASAFEIMGTYGTLGSWTNSGDMWHNTISFTEDNEYQFTLRTVDRAGNVSETYTSDTFTVDKTNPVMTVSWDNNSYQNENFYNANRTATVTVVEKNFDGSLFKLEGNGALSGWSSNGDTHTSTIAFTEDGEYEFSLSGQDKANNTAENFTSGKFILDKTIPILEVNGVQNSISYKDDLGFTVKMEDIHMDSSRTSVTLTGKRRGALKLSGSLDETSGSFVFRDFPKDESIDDIYTLEAVVVDKAGNEKNENITFSVNRFGSKYSFFDAAILGNYINKAQDVIIKEENVDKLDTNKARISVIRDGNDVDVKHELLSISEVADSNGKYSYEYKVGKDAFNKDGKYLVQVYSKAIEGTDYSSVSQEYAFVLDTKKPDIIISGVESGEQYKAYSRKVTIDVRDMSGVKDIVTKLNGEEVELSKKDGVYSFEVKESAKEQNIVVNVTDLAGNKSEGGVNKFLITSNTGLFIVNQTWFKVAVALVIILLITIISLIVLGRRSSRKDEEIAMKEHEDLFKASSSASSSSGVTTVEKDEVEDLDK